MDMEDWEYFDKEESDFRPQRAKTKKEVVL